MPHSPTAAAAPPELALAIAAVLAVAALLACAACSNDPAAVAASFGRERPEAEVITDFETIYSDSAQVKLRVSGPLLVRIRDRGSFVQEFPEGVHVDFFGDDGAVTATLDAERGYRYDATEVVVVQDSVIWRAVEGDRLDTDELTWDAQARRIYSDRFVRLRQGDKEITGVGFESNQDFSNSTVRAIQGVVTVDEPSDRP